MTRREERKEETRRAMWDRIFSDSSDDEEINEPRAPMSEEPTNRILVMGHILTVEDTDIETAVTKKPTAESVEIPALVCDPETSKNPKVVKTTNNSAAGVEELKRMTWENLTKESGPHQIISSEDEEIITETLVECLREPQLEISDEELTLRCHSLHLKLLQYSAQEYKRYNTDQIVTIMKKALMKGRPKMKWEESILTTRLCTTQKKEKLTYQRIFLEFLTTRKN